MFFAMISQFNKSLSNLDTILVKAIAHAEIKKFESNNYLTMRLSPDMFPFSRQVQIACDAAKGAASVLSGRDAPRFEDNETSMAELRERVKKTIAYLNDCKAEHFAQLKPDTVVKLKSPAGKAMRAQDLLLMRSTPNFFFHLTTAYDLLRQAGVELSKKDYLGEQPMTDA